MEPSKYFKRQCFVSVECDEDPVKAVVDLMGSDNIVFSTDFPHPDCKYPGAITRFLELPISDDAKRAILWDNTARYYGLA
jgi:predicted TIM-barrel fold metal-dependent hydrolase